MVKHEVGVLKDKDKEELHQMRIGMRRLRSAIAGFGPALLLPKMAREKNIAKIARILGKLRDIDVLEDTLQNKYQPALPKAEKKHLNEALKYLKKKRKYEFQQVKTTINDKDYPELKEAFEDWLEKPSYREIAEVSIEQVLPDLLLPQISTLLLHPSWLVGVKLKAGKIQFDEGMKQKEVMKLLDKKGNIVHSLRKEAKRTRYNMELFTQFYGDTYKKYLKDIKNIQTVVGEIQDCFVLAEFLTEVFESDIKRKVPTLSSELTKTRYERWQDYSLLPKQFLNIKTQQELRITVLNYDDKWSNSDISDRAMDSSFEDLLISLS